MGFHKRYIEKDNLLGQYRQGGIKDVMSYLTRADALICCDDVSSDVVDIYHDEEHETLCWIKIEEKLKKALGSEENLVY